jgi:hypothetical protein
VTCPDCQQKAAEKAGDTIKDHQKPDGSRETCPGSGKTAN